MNEWKKRFKLVRTPGSGPQKVHVSDKEATVIQARVQITEENLFQNRPYLRDTENSKVCQ